VAGSSTIRSAAQYVNSRGGVVVASAGNCGCVDGTAENPYIISVSATDAYDRIASWSSRGQYVDVSAPGAGIITTVRGGGYGSVSGTSFSAPIVAGVVALMLSANPGLGAAAIEQMLQDSADDLGTAGWDRDYGFGRVNAYRAVAAATGSSSGPVPIPDTTAPTATISSPASGSTVSGLVTVTANAADSTGVARVAFYLDGRFLGEDSTAPYGLAWDTTAVTAGSHVLQAVAYDAAGNAGQSPQVTVAVAQPTATYSGGADATAPTVTITSTRKRNGTLTVTVSATDNVGVARVALYVDGALVATDTSAPYAFELRPKSFPSGKHTVQAKATDAAGNVGVSPIITFER
jgi:hypothetical protein